MAELESGELIYTASFENPQRFGGSDIMHRISYDSGEFHGELQQVILSAINFEIGDMCRRLKIRRRHIYDMVVVGNSTMRDIFFGIDVQSIGEKPYKSLTEFELDSGTRDSTSITVNSKELGLRIFPAANVYSGPIVRGHVGADVAADLLAIGMDQQEDSLMLIDVGTNTEVI
ncbi:MAG: ferredoxin, partial [SAR202 cluster bacterium]|nr:ferredoxin [SAR202 cluster bacterium]